MSQNTFHGEFSSSDTSALSEANSRFALYGSRSTAAITLDATDVVTITDIAITSAGTNLTVSIYDGANATVDAGELIHKAIIPTNTVQSLSLLTAQDCQKGTYPKLKASGSGQVDAVIREQVSTARCSSQRDHRRRSVASGRCQPSAPAF
jgi:hypothetical protein